MIVFNICKNIPALDRQIEKKKTSCLQWISFRDHLVSVDTETQRTSEVFVWSHARWCLHGTINGWYLVPFVPKCIPQSRGQHSFFLCLSMCSSGCVLQSTFNTLVEGNDRHVHTFICNRDAGVHGSTDAWLTCPSLLFWAFPPSLGASLLVEDPG